MTNNYKTLVFIPAYRCERQIVRVLEQFTSNIQGLVDTVVVVDNQSPDSTLETAIEKGKEIFTQCQFIAWRNNANYGLGGSHKAAFRYAIENNFTHLIVLHGDDQANIHDLAPMLVNGEAYQYDCFLGSRFMNGSKLKGYSRFRTFGNRVYNTLFSIVTFRSIKDLGSGLNMYKLEPFKDFYYKTFPDDLTFNYLMLLGSINKSQNIQFFPITWTEEDQASNVKLVSQSLRVLGLLGGYALFRSRFLEKDVRAVQHDEYKGSIRCDINQSASPQQ